MPSGNQSLFDLTGRVAVITGGASGIGLAGARAYARAGAKVVIADLDLGKAAAAAAALTAQGLAAEAAAVDVARPESIDALFADAVARHGRLDIAFANAGISLARGPAFDSGSIARVDPAEWRKVLDVNMEGAFATVRAASAPMLAARRGRIVVTASTAALRSDVSVSYAYVMSKAAVANLVRQAAVEFAPHGVTVNAIAPGPIRTNIGGGRLHDETIAARVARAVPMGRVGEPEEIEGLLLLLGSDASSFITGVTVPIDGGMMAWGGAPVTS